MAILIPSIGSCVSRMTGGEKRLAQRLEQKLDADYLLWYDVPICPRHLHPDFVVMHPRRGVLILEVKDWSPKTIAQADKQSWQVFIGGQLKTQPNPAEQARQYAHAVVDTLKRDPQLVHSEGQYQGTLRFPWSYGVVFPNMTRKQFTDGQLDQIIEPHQVVCSDEMLEAVEYLARAHTAESKPILILCYNEPLAVKLASVMQAKGLAGRVHARYFHKWCRDQLVTYGQTLPGQVGRDQYVVELVQRVIHGVDRSQIPSGQYQAILIDEGHDFAPEWLKLITQMVDPATQSLLLLYDDAQSIYERSRKKNFSFKSVGVQAQGRTTILKINYRNTKQILQTASLIAADLLTADDRDEDGIPLVKPVSCGREGQPPLIIRLPSLRDEANKIAELLGDAHREGHAWGDMAIICRHAWVGDECAKALVRKNLPHQVRKGSGSFSPNADTIKVLTMHVSKGLEFGVVALAGVGQMPGAGEDEHEEARLFYVGATRATQRLVITVSGGGRFGRQLAGTAGEAHPSRADNPNQTQINELGRHSI